MSGKARVRRAPRALLHKGSVVSVDVRVSAEVMGGDIDREQFAAWVKTAITDYHRWRVGWVGLAMHCSIGVPSVSVRAVDEAEDS